MENVISNSTAKDELMLTNIFGILGSGMLSVLFETRRAPGWLSQLGVCLRLRL